MILVYACAQTRAPPFAGATDHHTKHRQQRSQTNAVAPSRRAALSASLILPGIALFVQPLISADTARASETTDAGAASDAITIVADQPGTGSAQARRGDILLVHYVGTLESGSVFDSTRGGLQYRDGGFGTSRPALVRLGGDPVPGLCAGLQAGLTGMRIGGTRTVTVPAALGFGSTTPVLAPYALVPPGSVLRYEIELVRLSRRGPDELMTGTSKCGAGGAGQQAAGCDAISPAEFV